MICYKCGHEAGREEQCPSCGADISVFQRIVKISKEKGLNAASDEKRVALLRARIARQAEISKNSQELEWLNSIVERSQGATVKVERDVYPNVEVRINDAKVLNRHKQSKVEFIEQHGKVVMLSLLDQ